MSDQEIAVRWLAVPSELEAAFALREEVFYGEQGVPRQEEFDGLDDEALHVVALSPEEQRVIGTLRVVLLEDGRAKIGRVVVKRDWRGRGIASRMLQLALEELRERGCEEVRLASQVQVVPLYERAGFAVESEPFQEAGIPHVWMGRRLVEPAESSQRQ
jgi:predicted GNAT family N-acyltransferase